MYLNSYILVTFSPDGSLLASASWNGTVRLWDSATGQPVHTLTGHAGWVRSVAFSPDGGRLASASGTLDEGMIRLWNPATGKLVRTLTGHESGA